MGIKEISKISTLARLSREEFWAHGSLLNQTRLDRFILLSICLHASVIIFQLLAPARITGPLAPPPIKVKYVEVQKPDSLEEKGTIVDSPKPRKVEKPRKSDLLASADSRAHANKKPPVKKEYQNKKTAVPQASGSPEGIRLAPTRARSNSPSTPSVKKSPREHPPLPLSEKGIFAAKTQAQSTPSTPSESLGSRGVLSMLDGFDAEKYAALDTRSPEQAESDDDQPISLDTTEAKYVSYFNRIKHQIQQVWTYPSEAAQRGINGQLTLRFEISREGNLLGVRLVSNSGFEILDMAALKAVKEAAPYYPFPITIPKKKISILATFIYSPNYNELNSQ